MGGINIDSKKISTLNTKTWNQINRSDINYQPGTGDIRWTQQ